MAVRTRRGSVLDAPYLRPLIGSSYVCGTPAVFSLAVTDAQHHPAGTVASTLGFSLPTCGRANSPIVFANQTLTASSSGPDLAPGTRRLAERLQRRQDVR